MKSVQRFVIWIALTLGTFGSGAQAQCFSPLADPKSRIVTNWNDLLRHSPADSERGPNVTTFLRIPEGRGDKINLDFYSITFAKPPATSLEEVFRTLRLNFQLFARGPSRDYDFFAYPEDAETNAESTVNKERWGQPDPKGAVMRFSLLGFWLPTLALSKSAPKRFLFVAKAGDVQCTCASPRDFIFSTVDTADGGKHPVAGNRGFGLRDNNDGTWTFYTKGADRESTFFGNYVPDNQTSDVVPRETVFQKGHAFWQFFFKNMEAYLNSKGMTVRQGSFVENSDRASYPLGDGV